MVFELSPICPCPSIDDCFTHALAAINFTITSSIVRKFLPLSLFFFMSPLMCNSFASCARLFTLQK